MKSAIKKVLKEELNDYYGLVDHTWHIDFKNEEESIEGQKWLFKNGFQWAGMEQNILKGRRSVQSIWQDNVDARTFTGSDGWPYSESLRVTKYRGLEDPIHIIWSDFRVILDIDFDMTSGLFDSLNESDNSQSKPEIGDYLYAKHDLFLVQSGEKYISKDEVYEIIGKGGTLKDRNDVTVIDLRKRKHRLSKNYRETNFILIPKDEFDIDPFDKLYESEEDDLEWAQDIVSNTPKIYIDPFPPRASQDNVTRIIRSRNRDTTEKTINDLMDLLFSLGYQFRGVRYAYEEKTISRYLNNGGYLRLFNTFMTYGDNEALFKSTNGMGYSEVPNYFI